MKTVLALAAVLIAAGAQAQPATFPTKPVRIVVPYAPGGGCSAGDADRALTLGHRRHPAVPAPTLREFVTHAKANPGKLPYAWYGMYAPKGTPEEFAAYTRSEHEKFARLIKAAGIQP
ncbi:MAG: hypothetical protein AABM33_09785 [Pseudomonadota bacterium]